MPPRGSVRRLLPVLVLAVGLVVPAGAVAAPAGDAPAPVATMERPTDDGRNASVGVGQQLATVVSVARDDVGSDVEAVSFEAAFERADGDERAALVADRAGALADRASAIRAAYREATAAYRAGELDESAYAQRVAALNSRAANLRERVAQLQAYARNVSALELRAAGLNRSTLRAAVRDLEAVTGTGPRALLERFTGERTGELEIEADGGLSIAVESEDGERSREITRPRDGDPSLTVAQAAALSTARAALTDVDGRWVLTRSRVRHDDGYYAFAFELRGNRTTGEAEVAVDGSTGAVFELEEEIAPTDDEDEEDEEDDGDESDERDDDAPALAVVVAEGTPGPGEPVTIRVLADGTPVAGATVTVNDQPAGTTGADGTVRVVLPVEDADVEAEYRGADADLSLEFERDGDRADPAVRHLAVDATYDAGTVSLRLTYNGSGVGGVAVEANGEAVGRTAPDGTLAFGIDDADDLELEFAKGAFETEREYVIRDGSLVPEDEAESDDDGDDR